jgi:hypothetical protein
MKTVLAPNAPWPKYNKEGEVIAKPKPKPKPRPKPPKRDASKIARTDKNFEEWADKNLVRKFK